MHASGAAILRNLVLALAAVLCLAAETWAVVELVPVLTRPGDGARVFMADG